MEALAGLLSFVWLLLILGLIITFVPSVRLVIARRILAPYHLPLRRVRWTLGLVAVALFITIGIIAPAEKHSASSGWANPGASRAARETPAPEESGEPPTISELCQQQVLDARLALCVAVDHAFQDARPGKDAIVLANQFSVGKKAGGRAIEHEWASYQKGDWHDSDCHNLSLAHWRQDEGYWGDTINLPDGTIDKVVHEGDLNRQMDAALALGNAVSADQLGSYSNGQWSNFDALAEFEKRNPGSCH